MAEVTPVNVYDDGKSLYLPSILQLHSVLDVPLWFTTASSVAQRTIKKLKTLFYEMWFISNIHFNFSRLKFINYIRYHMVFVEPMHPNRSSITYIFNQWDLYSMCCDHNEIGVHAMPAMGSQSGKQFDFERREFCMIQISCIKSIDHMGTREWFFYPNSNPLDILCFFVINIVKWSLQNFANLKIAAL